MASLVRQSYGKHQVRVSKVKRTTPQDGNAGQHEFFQASVNIELEGSFEAAYTEGDNQSVIATDTCRNTVYVLAKDDPIVSLESFGVTIANHFLERYAHVERVTVTLEQQLWHRLLDSPHGFIGNDRETPTAKFVGVRNRDGSTSLSISAGITDCMLAKTTKSGFSNFHRDEFRTLPDTDDRILGTVLSAAWNYSIGDAGQDFNAHRSIIRDALLTTFLNHYSRSVQETLFRMASSALERCREIESITLTMPNKHHIRFNLEPFGRANDNEVFVVTDQPFGFITATVAR